MDTEELQDPLKPLGQICQPDVRQQNFAGGLENRHAALSKLNLLDTVPLDVRQLFETAKNVCLYTWFVYRFHQVAEMTAYSSLERALRIRFYQENPARKNSKKPAMLGELIKYALDQKWLKSEGFSHLKAIARGHAEAKKIRELTNKSPEFIEHGSAVLEEPTEEEIQEVLKSMSVDGILDASRDLRNDLAHGSSTLHPNSFATLQVVAETINQIYPKSVSK